MNIVKILWVLVGLLSFVLVATLGYVFLNKEDKTSEISETLSEMQAPIILQENKSETQVIKSGTSTSIEKSLDVIFPNGGESFDVNKSLTIRYKVGESFKKQLTALDRVELYLVDNKNSIVGFIGEVNKTSSEFNWNTRELFRNCGLDFCTDKTSPGQYRILLVARKGYDAGTIPKDLGINTLDGFKYSNGKILSSETNEVWREQPIASNISTSFFTLNKSSSESASLTIGSNKSLLEQVTKGVFFLKYLDETLILQNGQYIRYEEPRLALQISKEKSQYTEGDLNSDGKKDLVIMYHVSGGGSGGYVYLGVFLNDNGTAKYFDSIQLGDSTSIESLMITDNLLKVVATTFPDGITQVATYRISNNLIKKLN